MTQRLPVPGQDEGNWGDILNSFLTVSHAVDGTLNDNTVGTAQLQDNVLTDAQLSGSAAISPTKIAGTAEVTANKGQALGYASLNSAGLVPTTELGTGTASSSNYLRGDGTWVVPTTGSSSLASDSDVTITSPASTQLLTYNGTKWVNANASNATTSAPGTVQLAGDLSGTALIPRLTATTNVEAIISANTLVAGAAQKANSLSDIGSVATARTNLGLGSVATLSSSVTGDLSGTLPSPTVAKVNGVTISGTPSSGQVITASGTTTANWSTPTAGITLDAIASDIHPLGTQAAGSVGKAADAGHVHAMPTAAQVGALPSSDDLSAIATANPTAASVVMNSHKITGLANGTVASDAAAYGQIPLVGTTGGTYAAGNDSRIVGSIQQVAAPTGIASTDTANIQTAVSAGGQVRLGVGTYMINATITVGSNVQIVGTGIGGTIVEKTSSWTSGNALFNFSGTNYTTRNTKCSMRDLQLNGNEQTGPLIQADHCDHFTFDNVYSYGNNDITVAATDLWDTYFEKCAWDWCSGSNGGTAKTVVLQNDPNSSTNAIWFTDCRWENFKDGALQLTGNSQNLHGIYLEHCKMETSVAHDAFINMTTDVRDIRVRDCYLALDSLDSGVSGPITAIVYWHPYSASTLSNVHIWVGTASSVYVPITLFLGASYAHDISDISCEVDTLSTVPTGGLINFESSTAAGSIQNVSWGTTGVTQPLFLGTGNYAPLLIAGISASGTPIAGQALVATTTSAASWSAVAGTAANTFTGNQTAPAFVNSGLTGAKSASRYVGATSSGAPTSGTFAIGDYIIDQTAKIWVCTVAGTPGTWTQVTGATSGSASGDLSGSYPSPTVTTTHLSAALPLNQGGTGSITQNFVDISSVQSSIAGAKTFTAATTHSAGIVPINYVGWTMFGLLSTLSSITGNVLSPTAGTIYWAAAYIPYNCTLTGIQVQIGTTGGTDKWVVGLYNAAGALVANSSLSGATAGTASTTQQIPFTSTFAATGPTVYYTAIQSNGTTAKFLGQGNTTIAGIGTGSQAGSFGTLATITPGSSFTSGIPLMATY